MLKQDMSFNISIMKVDKDRVRTLKPVTSSDIMGTSGQALIPTEKLDGGDQLLSWLGEGRLSSDFHEGGLFSTSIFGRIGDPDRDKRFSFIDIKVKVFHPVIYKSITKLNRLYTSIITGKGYAIWDEKEKDFLPSNEIDGETGFSFFAKHWESIKFKKNNSPARNQRIDLINKYKANSMTDKILVLPAGLRDVRVGNNNRLEFDEINDVYKKIVSVSRTINVGGMNLESKTLDYSRLQIQNSFNTIYEHFENLLNGKSGYMQNKWAKRKVFNGTRNVLSSMNTSKSLIGDPNTYKTTDTIVGLFQFMRGSLQLVIHHLRHGYLSDVFGIGNIGNTVSLIDPVTLKKEIVEVNPLTKDRWTTVDGLDKVINTFEQVENRHKPVMIEDRYLALIYKGPDMTFKVFHDIDELPEHLDRKYVSPITLCELLYLSGYKEWYSVKAIITRYPVTELGSTYPSDVYVKTTTVGEVRKELDGNWEEQGDEFTAKEFPRSDVNSFLESMNVSSVRIAGLGAD